MALQSMSRNKVLQSKVKISDAVTTTSSTTTALDAAKRMEIFDENGKSLGWVAIYTTLAA